MQMFNIFLIMLVFKTVSIEKSLHLEKTAPTYKEKRIILAKTWHLKFNVSKSKILQMKNTEKKFFETFRLKFDVATNTKK